MGCEYGFDNIYPKLGSNPRDFISISYLLSKSLKFLFSFCQTLKETMFNINIQIISAFYIPSFTKVLLLISAIMCSFILKL